MLDWFLQDKGMHAEKIMIDRSQHPILENLATAVIVLDSELQIKYVNPAAEMLFEISAQKACGRHWIDIAITSAGFLDLLQSSLDTTHPFSERELALTITNNKTVTVDCTVTPLLEPVYSKSLLIEIVSLDRQLQISKEETLISQHHAVSALVRGLAHEIKNPLGGLRGAAQLLERELPSEELKEFTQVIIHEADRLQNLVDRMLGPITLPVKQRVNIHMVMERVRSLARAEAPTGISVKFDYDPSIPDLNADPEQLIQAVLNLVRNALEALGEEGEIILRTRTQRQFTIGHQRHKLVALVEVIDNGPGIAEEMMDTIFFPMITGRVGGSGLGLSIAQSLINRHGGLIECKSRPGKTVFQILLPLENS